MIGRSSSTMKRKREWEPTQCQICRSTAVYRYFGVISCEACKVFFKRNGLHGQNHFKCLFDNQCEINPNNRQRCTSCRLAKCFQKGMRPEMIRRSTTIKKNSPISNILVKSNQIAKLPSMNLLDKDISSLDDSQWTLLSNLVHNYQEGQLFSLSQTIKHENNSLGILNPSTVQQLLKSFYEMAGNSLRSNADIVHLESYDRSILLQTAANNLTCIGGIMMCYHSQLIQYELFCEYLENIYGKITFNCQRWATQFIEPDMILCKLAMNLFAFSTNTRVFLRQMEEEYQDAKQILRIQDKYAEVAWKYLLYKYGYEDSVKRYVHIIEWLLALTIFMQYAHNTDVHVNDVESLVEQTEIALILDDVDRIIENKM